MGFPAGATGKEPTCQHRRYEMQVQSLGWEDPLEEGMATHSSSFAWRIPWTEEPGGLQSTGSWRVGPDSSDLEGTQQLHTIPCIAKVTRKPEWKQSF